MPLSQNDITTLLQREQEGTLSPDAKVILDRRRAEKQFPPPLPPSEIRATPSTMQQLEHVGKGLLTMAPETIGAMGGGMIGGIPGAMGGAALGRAGLEAIQSLPGPTYRGYEKSFSDVLKDILTSGALGGLGEGVGRGVTKIAEKVLPPLFGTRGAQVFLKGPKLPNESQRIVDIAKQEGVPLSAAQITKSPILSQLESIPTRTPIGVGPIRRFAEKQTQALTRALERYESSLGRDLPPGAAGEAVQWELKATEAKARQSASRIYKAVEQAMGDQPIIGVSNTSAIGAEIRAEQEELLSLAKPGLRQAATNLEQIGLPQTISSSSGKRAANFTPEEFRELIKNSPAEFVNQFALTEGRQITFRQAQSLQSELGQRIETATTDKARRQWARLFAGISNDIESFARTQPEIGQQLRLANKFYRTQVGELFGRKTFLRSLHDKDPERIVDLLYSRQRVGDIRLLKRSVPEQTFNDVKRALFDKALRGDQISEAGAFDPTTKVFSPRRFLTKITGNGALPGRMWKTILGEQHYSKLTDLVEMMQAIERSEIAGANPSQTARGILGHGQVLTGLHLAGRVAATPFLGPPGAAVSFAELTAILGPEGLARIMTSERGIRLMTETFKAKPGTQQALRLTSQLMTFGGKQAKSENAP